MHKKNILTTPSLALWPLILVFRVQLEQVIPLSILFWIKFSAFFVFMFMVMKSLRQGKQWLKITGVLLIVLSFATIYFDLSTKIFLGQVIGEEYIADAPVFIELKVYERKCTFGYGGIFEVTNVFYCDYEIEDGIFWILTDKRILELEHSIFNVLGQELEIKRKPLYNKNYKQ